MHARVRELVGSVTRFHRCQIAVKLEYYAYCIEHEDGLVESKTNYIERPNASACPCYANVAWSNSLPLDRMFRVHFHYVVEVLPMHLIFCGNK